MNWNHFTLSSTEFAAVHSYDLSDRPSGSTVNHVPHLESNSHWLNEMVTNRNKYGTPILYCIVRHVFSSKFLYLCQLFRLALIESNNLHLEADVTE